MLIFIAKFMNDLYLVTKNFHLATLIYYMFLRAHSYSVTISKAE